MAPSINFDVGPVLRHCLRARRNLLIRNIVLLAIAIAGLVLWTPQAVGLLIFSLILALLLPNASRRRRRLRRTAGRVLGIVIAVVLGLVVLSFVVRGGFASAASVGDVPGIASFSVSDYVDAFALLLAAATATEFVYLHTTFRTLDADLRSGAQLPRAVSEAAESRITMVEGAQRGNITLHSGWFPFIGAGPQTKVHWSIAIRLRPKTPVVPNGDRVPASSKYVRIDPYDLHRQIHARLLGLNDPALPANERVAALTVSHRVIGSGLLGKDNPLLDPNLKTPYSHASPEAIEALIRHPQARLRYYQQVSVSDQSPVVESRSGRPVAMSVDQEVAVSAFIYAAVEGGMFYLQFVLTALPPIDHAYRIDDFSHVTTFFGTLMYSIKRLFGSLVSAPLGIIAAVSLWRSERAMEKEYTSSDDSDFGTLVSVRQIAAAPSFGTYIEELDVEKYNMMISRLLLETVEEYLDGKGVDTSAFESSAQTIVNNGDFNYVRGDNNTIDQFGGRGNRHEEPARQPRGAA